MNVFNNDSKTDLKLRCDNCMNSMNSGVPKVWSRLTTICCMLLPTTPTYYPSTTRGKSVGPSCCCKHRFLWISLIFEHLVFLNYMGTVCHWQPFWSRKSFCFIGQCCYFNPQWTQEWAIIKARGARHVLCHLVEMHSYKVTAYISVFVKGFRRWRGYNLSSVWKPDLQGYCSIANHSK